MEKILIQLVMVISVMLFVGSQGSLCIAMPQEWFAGLVSGIVAALCIWYHLRGNDD